MNDVPTLANVSVLGQLPKDQVAELVQCSVDHAYNKRFVLYIPGDALTELYLVKEGEVVLYHLTDGKRIVFDVMGPGDMFGNFSRSPIAVSHFAEVTPGTRLCTIPVANFLELIQKHPEAMLSTLQMLSRRLGEYESKIAMCPAPAKEKILAELKRYQEKHPKQANGTYPPVALTHQKIANMTALNRVTVTRGLQELAESGSITIEDDGIRIL